MKARSAFRPLAIILFMALLTAVAAAQGVKRIVVIKIDGLPGYYVDRFVKERDPVTGKSVLPWIDEVFYKNGSHLENFYTRGMSLSGPSWGLLDTGQHLQIKGNVEYDRYTLHPYDYLNFIPYYNDYRKGTTSDMPAVQVLDQLHIPLLMDAFPVDRRYTAHQLYQRGASWLVIGKGLANLYPGSVNDMMDEWTTGLALRDAPIDQEERDIIRSVVENPRIDYFDYYDEAFDHVSHHNNDTFSRVVELKKIDQTVGRIWTAIQRSDRRDETALIVVSDHGFNSEDKVYSQGFSLVRLLRSAAGGAHHVVTKRRLMLDYAISGLNPFVPMIKTASSESFYLKDRQNDYPTALLDFDGNERSSLHLRNSDLNVLHILLLQMQKARLDERVREAAANEFFRVVERHRPEWQEISTELHDELNALHRSIEDQRRVLGSLPTDSSRTKAIPGFDQQKARLTAFLKLDTDTEQDYRSYVATLDALLDLKPGFDARKVKIEDLIARGAMGEQNSIYQLQNYVAGPGPNGLVLKADGSLDIERSFVHVDYPSLLHEQRVRSNPQPEVSNRPIDFVSIRFDASALKGTSLASEPIDEDPIWIFGSDQSQAILLSKHDPDGRQSYKYVPVSGLKGDDQGGVTFRIEKWGPGFPLHFFEDPEFRVPADERESWITQWHSEYEWLIATHRTKYSNAVIGLNEQLDDHPVQFSAETADEKLLRRFRARQRRSIRADMLILANDHWNFDVRGFNPGGNHGSFFRVSTNSTLMFAGGDKTGIPRGKVVTEPYDSLSLVPTVLTLMGKVDRGRPVKELQALGYTQFPGRVISEIIR